MAQSLSNIAGPDLNQPFTGQFTALTGRKPTIPLSDIIHAKVPAYRMARGAQLEREFAEKAHEETLALEEKKLEEAEKQAETATGIEATALGGFAGHYAAKAYPAFAEAAPFGGVIGGAGAVGLEFAKDPLEEWAEEQGGSTGEAAMGIAVRAGQGYMLAGPYGAAIGAGIGIVEEVIEGTMLCTELNRQGLLPDDIYHADCDYSKTISMDVVIGYQTWARHLVPVMAKNKPFTRFVGMFVRAWAYHAAYKAGAIPKGNRFGALIELIGVPICRIIGKIVYQKEAKLTFVNVN